MKQLVLIRHGESEWNKLNLFTGWTDVELSEKGWEEAKAAGQLMREEGFDFDLCLTSYLKRAIHTAQTALAQMDLDWIPMEKHWELNERHYGALQGLNKAETAEKYGEEQVTLWRRSYDVCPPALEESDRRNPARDRRYQGTPAAGHPLTESLEITVQRVIPFYEKIIVPRGVTRIENRAFADCPNLKLLELPEGITFEGKPLEGTRPVFVYGAPGSYLEAYAEEVEGLYFIPIT